MNRRTITTAALTAGLLALVAGPAAAHVTANPNTAEAGGRAATTIVVPHGCDGSPTTTVEVAIPEEVESVTPEQVAGWEAEITDESVLWTAEDGEALADDQFRGFGLRLALPDSPGEVLWLPTVQTCEDGESAWIEIPEDLGGWDDLDHPAPYLELTEATGDHGHGSEEESEGSADDEVAEDDELAVDPIANEGTGTDTLVVVAVVIGVLGAALGAAGLVTARKRT